MDEFQPEIAAEGASGQRRKNRCAGRGLRPRVAARHTAVHRTERPRSGHPPEREPLHAMDGRIPSHVGGFRRFEQAGWGQSNGISVIFRVFPFSRMPR